MITGIENECMSTIDPRQTLSWISATNAEQAVSIKTTTSTASRRITVFVASIVGWNVQPTAFSNSNSISSQVNVDILTSFATQTRSAAPANHYRLSSGATAKIGVSADVDVIIVVILIAWTVILRRRSRSLSTKMKISEESRNQSHRADSNGVCDPPQSSEFNDFQQVNELGRESLREICGSQINEFSHRSLYELDPADNPVEMSLGSPKGLKSVTPLNRLSSVASHRTAWALSQHRTSRILLHRRTDWALTHRRTNWILSHHRTR